MSLPTDISFSYPDQLEFETLYEESFKTHTYYVDLDRPSPLIIDCGANIGMTALYFHKQYPRARLICVEPDPKNLTYLQKNLTNNAITNVTVIPKALVGKDGPAVTTLYSHPTWGVFSSLKKGGWTEDQGSNALQVETVRLSQLITEPVDLLKIDIEGYETLVIEEAREKLHWVTHCLIEFHETAAHSPERILRILREHFKSVEITEDKRKEKKKTDQLLFISASNNLQ